MLRLIHRRNLVATLLLSTAACTQAPAQIDLRGQNSYSRDSASSYASNSSSSNYSSYSPSSGASSGASQAPISFSTQSSAGVSSIGVSDLTPPSSGAGTPAKNTNNPWHSHSSDAAPVKATPFKTASVEEIKPVEIKSVEPKSAEIKGLPSEHINPWTHKPRDVAASNALDQSFSISPKGKTAQAAKEPMVSEVKSVAAKESSGGLDSIVSSDDDSKPMTITKPVKKEQVASSSGFMWPVNSKKVISEFGPKGKGKVNEGINIASAQGEPVWAAADGEVVYVGNELQGYGNIILIKHSGNKTTTYAHLNRYTVDKYERVKQGDIIGYVGNTGNVKEPQLHFAVRNGKDAVDPMKYLSRNVASLH